MDYSLFKTLLKSDVPHVHSVQLDENPLMPCAIDSRVTGHVKNMSMSTNVQHVSMNQPSSDIGHQGHTEIKTQMNMSTAIILKKPSNHTAFHVTGHTGHSGHEKNRKSLQHAHKEELACLLSKLHQHYGGNKSEWQAYIKETLRRYGIDKVILCLRTTSNEALR